MASLLKGRLTAGRVALGVFAFMLATALAVIAFWIMQAPDVVEPEERAALALIIEVPEREPEPIRWPFSGIPIEEGDDITRRPLSVKIENSTAARPQTGLNAADVVYETIAEGGITRFNAIYQSTIPKQLGPVRSARLSDLWIVPQYDGLFFFSGANSTVLSRVRNSTIDNMSHNAASSLYKRVSFRSAPHNLYIDANKAHDLADSKGFDITGEYVGFEWGKPSEETTLTATTVSIPFSSYANVKWEWDADDHVYKRFHGTTKHMDAATDEQVRASNVVVMWAKYTPQSKKDAAGSLTYDIDLGGSGKAEVFKDGVRIKATWEATRDTPPVLLDRDGKVIKLNPGTTWFEVPPTTVKISSK